MQKSDFPLYRYRGSIRRVIDGDTFECLLDLGDRTYRVRRIRILGYDAPELIGANNIPGFAAKQALEAMLPVGEMVYIATHLDRSTFDRLLGRVFVKIDDDELVEIAGAMIAQGHGVPA